MSITEKLQKGSGSDKRGVKKKSNIGILVCALCALCIFGGLLLVQMSLANEDAEYYKDVYVASVDILEGTHITEDNVSEYVTTVNTDIRTIPDSYITVDSGSIVTDLAAILDKYTNESVLANEVIVAEDFDEYDFTEGIQDPIEVAFEVSGINVAVAGTVREGDLINIYCVREDTTKTNEYIVEPLYLNKRVVNSYTSGGDNISNDDTTTVTMVTIYIDASEEEMFNLRTTDSSLRISRVVQ